MIKLAEGPWHATVFAGVGGCLAALDRDGVPILRPMDEEAGHPLESACFPLVPYCNRIAVGRFEFGGRDVRIEPNLAGDRHPLHGTGWLRPWRVMRITPSSVLLEDDYQHGDGDWPWPYRAHQHIALDASGLTIRLIAENRAAEAAPIGLGLHPYLRRRPETKVAFDAAAMLGIDAGLLPDGTVHGADALAPFSAGAELPPVLVDNCFTGWSGFASIWDELGAIVVRGFGAPYLHVFAPPGGAELCLEPVSHSRDALNRAPAEMTLLPPGAAAGIAIRIEVG